MAMSNQTLEDTNEIIKFEVVFWGIWLSLTDRELDYYGHQATNRTKDPQTQKLQEKCVLATKNQ